MRRISKLGIVGSGVCALALTVASPAFADYGPSGTDIVGVGSDTVQNIGNFVADGDFHGGFGYNAADNPDKWVSFDATPDANDRAGYLNNSTNGTGLKPLVPTIVLREGTSPVQRPNGSGAGIAALLLDKTQPYSINYVRSSRLPNSGENSTAISDGFGFLHVVQVSTDPLEMAFQTGSANFPTTALSAQQLVGIYQCTITTWSAVGVAGDTNTIIPEIPQAGSGTRSTFLADLQTANGGTALTLGGCVQTVEENDPTAITGLNSTAGLTAGEAADGVANLPANAIVPFSLSRLNLWNAHYFNDPSKAFGVAPVPLNPGISIAHGCPTFTDVDCQGTSPVHSNASDSNPIYNDVRGLYYIFRNSDAAAAPAGFNGTTLNWVQALLSNPASPTSAFLDKHSTQALITSAGATPSYNDLGHAFTTP